MGINMKFIKFTLGAMLPFIIITCFTILDASFVENLILITMSVFFGFLWSYE